MRITRREPGQIGVHATFEARGEGIPGKDESIWVARRHIMTLSWASYAVDKSLSAFTAPMGRSAGIEVNQNLVSGLAATSIRRREGRPCASNVETSNGCDI